MSKKINYKIYKKGDWVLWKLPHHNTEYHTGKIIDEIAHETYRKYRISSDRVGINENINICIIPWNWVIEKVA